MMSRILFLNLNLTVLLRNHIISKPIYVLGSLVQQSHKVILMPLIYTKLTDRYMGMKMDKNKATVQRLKFG